MDQNEELTQGTFNDDDYEEEWTCILNTKGRYTLSKNQARLVLEAMAHGERGTIVFQTFVIPVAYVAEFYREKRFLKNAKQLPSKASEPEYVPMSPEKLAEWRKKVYEKIGKPMPK